MSTSFQQHRRNQQRGMGATVILFTIALIVLVGAALAYGSRGNSKAFTGESAKVMSSVLLKQSAEYRDAYNRFIFDGGNAVTVTLDNATTGLFEPSKQYGIKQDPPLKAFETAAAQIWLMSKLVAIPGVGTGIASTVTFLPGLQVDVCKQVNLQLYGSDVIPDESTPLSAATIGSAGGLMASATSTGRAAGCVKTAGTAATQYVFYSTLAEN
jgi:hypothetical protein